ncbi:hypothetical protein [Haloarcula sp. CBA1127]|uniref:hypothetical protein n=1 Tax=Haloarcula sp. CBA1127 TaxID=1765055 RepID=UPI00073F54CE|nr:hypothetical protein [Haloarcula sp. CBA1127]
MSTIAAKRADRSTDGMFAFVLGLFVALLAVAPTVTATAVWGGVDADAALYIVALLTVAVVTGLGWLATWRRPGLAVALGDHRPAGSRYFLRLATRLPHSFLRRNTVLWRSLDFSSECSLRSSLVWR